MSEELIAGAVREWLRETGLQGWTVAVELDRSDWAVHLDHPASAGMITTLARQEPAAAIAEIITSLRHRDELRIASAAPDLEHRGVVMGIRTLTQAFAWSRTEVRSVARLFQEHDLLTAAEADWLSDWTGDTADPNLGARQQGVDDAASGGQAR